MLSIADISADTETLQSAKSDRIQVWLVTGFFGAGKTTVLNACIHAEGRSGTAVIVNEVAGLNIDPMLIQRHDGEIVVINGGCVCCVVRDELVEALFRLEHRRHSGNAPTFNRLLIETTGLADPSAVIHALLCDPRLNATYELMAVLTVVDATHLYEQLERFEEAQRQIAAADYLLISKKDLCDAASMDRIGARLTSINPMAVHMVSHCGRISCVQGEHPISLFSLRRAHEEWQVLQPNQVTHSAEIEWHVIEIEHPIEWKPFIDWLQALCLARGRDLLRFKGIVFTREHSYPVAIQAVHFTIYPEEILSSSVRTTNAITQLVFIGRRLDLNALRRTLAAATRPGF
jgi:G3E family GTPase